MTKAKPKSAAFPKECCGCCRFSDFTLSEVTCVVNPPVYIDGGWHRGAPVSPRDQPCEKFKPKEHA